MRYYINDATLYNILPLMKARAGVSHMKHLNRMVILLPLMKNPLFKISVNSSTKGRRNSSKLSGFELPRNRAMAIGLISGFSNILKRIGHSWALLLL